jgi:hypothetical protein
MLAHKIINADHGGDIEAISQDGTIQLQIDLKPVLGIPEDPRPYCRFARPWQDFSFWSGFVPPILALNMTGWRDAEYCASWHLSEHSKGLFIGEQS